MTDRSRLSGTFLTALDARRRIKGSRDPLGFQPLWARLGRHLVANITTVSADVRGYTTLLFAVRVADRLRREHGLDADQLMPILIRAEQVAAYSRIVHADDDDETGIRGFLGAKRNLDRGGPLPLGESGEARILADQRVTGVWGQIGSPARESGLLDRRDIRLTPAAEAHADRTLLAPLERWWGDFSKLALGERPFEPGGRHRDLSRAVAGLHRPVQDEAERVFYRLHLLRAGQPTDAAKETPVQVRFALLLTAWNDEQAAWTHPVGRAEIEGWAASCADDPALQRRLLDILAAEALLGPAATLFANLLTRDGQPLATLLRDIRSTWSGGLASLDTGQLDALDREVRETYGAEAARPMGALAEAFAEERWEDVVPGLVALNARTMARRGGGPWAEVVDEALKVRFREESGGLAAGDPSQGWIHPYYLGAFKQVARQLGGLR
jgi:hypothetical protein